MSDRAVVMYQGTGSPREVDLGVLNGGPYSSARAINNKGQTIGNALDGATLIYHQVLRNRTTISDWSTCYKGQIVGERNLMPDGPMHALRWTVKPGQAPVVERP